MGNRTEKQRSGQVGAGDLRRASVAIGPFIPSCWMSPTVATLLLRLGDLFVFPVKDSLADWH
jgi:hypothetical protein